MLVLLGVLVTSVTFANWSESLFITGSVSTGELCWEFKSVFIEDDQEGENDWNCGDNFEPSPWRTNKDVGKSSASIKDPHTVEVILQNVYPSYFTEVSVYARNVGTVPLHFEKVLIDSVEITGGYPKIRLDLDGNGENDIEIWWLNNIGAQIHPGWSSPEISFWIHVLQSATQNGSMRFTISLVAVQYNESIHPLPKPQIISVKLHPDNVVDSTDGDLSLPQDNLKQLENSDDNRYRTEHKWKGSYDEKHYLDFDFDNITIPPGATVDNVVLKFEWQRPSEVDNARLRIWDGFAWSDYYYLTLPSPGMDDVVTLDLKADYGIDTATEVNNLRVRFQATDGKEAYTWHDWVEVQVTYTV
ncbi:MAG: hypothetical protein QW603_01155 [Candidatus Hadarchaeales archaeon]